MSKILAKLEKFAGLLRMPSIESLNMSLADVHHPGLFSLVIGGIEPGNLTRVFIATQGIEPYTVQLHSHRYPIKLTTLKGIVGHTYVEHTLLSSTVVAPFGNGKTIPGYVGMDRFKYRSPLNGGSGLEFETEVQVKLREYVLPIGSTIYMDENDIHTVACYPGAIWVVEEQGFKVEESTVLGVPFTVDGLYNKPQQFQINDMCQMVLRELNYLIDNYKKAGL